MQYTIYNTNIMDDAKREACSYCYHNITEPESSCQTHCGAGTVIDTMIMSHGYGCSQCLLANEGYQALNATEKTQILDCVALAKFNNEPIF